MSLLGGLLGALNGSGILSVEHLLRAVMGLGTINHLAANGVDLNFVAHVTKAELHHIIDSTAASNLFCRHVLSLALGLAAGTRPLRGDGDAVVLGILGLETGVVRLARTI